MKIVIVGAGIAGLTTYLHLRKHLPHTHTIKIYESHQPRSKLPSSTHPEPVDDASPSPQTTHDLDTLSASTAIVGGGLGVSPNGIRVLRKLDRELYDAVIAQGFPVEKFVFKGANGWALGRTNTSDKLVRGTVDGEEEVCVASSRHGLWRAIMDRVGEGVVEYKKVLSIVRDGDDGKTIIKLIDEDGEESLDEANLVIGADGVKSVVRTALFGEDENSRPKYTGLSGVGGFLQTPIPASIVDPSSMVFSFGGNGFFGYSSGGPVSAQSLMWWSTFETAQLPDPTNIDPVAIKAALLKRHRNWKDPIVQDIIKRAPVESIYPTWVLEKLPHWGENGIVLIGDAAHALDPTTGQGASQAFEDSQTLALLLKEVLQTKSVGDPAKDSEREKVNLAIKLFYEIRAPRVHEIVERGKKLSGSKTDVGVVTEYFLYFFLWLLNRFPIVGKALLGDVNKTLYTWTAENEIKKAFEKLDTSNTAR